MSDSSDTEIKKENIAQPKIEKKLIKKKPKKQIQMVRRTLQKPAPQIIPLKPKKQIGSKSLHKLNFKISEHFFPPSQKSPVKTSSFNLSTKTEPNETLLFAPKIPSRQNLPPLADVRRRQLKARIETNSGDNLFHQPLTKSLSEKRLGLMRYVKVITGKECLHLNKQWVNSADDKVSMDPWDVSNSTLQKEDEEIRQAAWCKFVEGMKKRKVKVIEGYKSPQETTEELNRLLREKKEKFREEKVEILRELRLEFPFASMARLNAIADRLIDEFIFTKNKVENYPIFYEGFKPNLSFTKKKEVYVERYHSGVYGMNELEKQKCWSCCMNFEEGNEGCLKKITNPDAWCYLSI